MMAWRCNLAWSDRVSHTTLEITNDLHFNFPIDKLYVVFQRDTNYWCAFSKTFVKPRACALFEDHWWTHLQCKYCFQMQHWRNCLHWLQLPFVDTLCSTQFASKHHQFNPLALFHVRLQSSSTLYLSWIFFPAVDQLSP